MRLELDSPLRAVRGVGPSRSAALAAAGYRTVGELLYHLPHRYADRRSVVSLAEVAGEGTYTLRGHLAGLTVVRTRRRSLTLVRGRLVDGGRELPVVWFNRPYLASQVCPGQLYQLCGPVRRRGARSGGAGTVLELVNPTCEAAATAVGSGRVVPVYPALGRLGPAAVRRLLEALVEDLEPALAVVDPLPWELRARYGMPPLGEALDALHRPPADVDAEALNRRRSPAHLRLIYGELLELQLELALTRSREVAERQSFRYRVDDAVRQAVRRILPFRLTAAQRRALGEIVDDLRSPHPMLRLLQGDVGSGKTIVAALSLVVAVESGLQGAFMAPTELLAEQHFATLERLLGAHYRLALLTRSSPRSDRDRRRLAAGEIDLAVGTHALIQESTGFHRLGLVVIDEQHRFGVLQRQLLEAKGEHPDVLVMTATPIPRSLALTAYGDLETSTLDELPPGRTPVATQVVPAARRARVYQRLRREIEQGARAYVVFPLIEDSDQLEAESVERRSEELRNLLGPETTAVVHGRVPAAEREAILEAFAAGRVRALLATTVIEVGIDVPQATVMIIESAERFGLSQLHQLRGRVGRGRRPSRCVALHGRLGREARRRLEVFRSTTDGFRIAEEDLEIRGPGDLLGTRQAGLPSFRAARLIEDREWLERAREDARALLPHLDRPDLLALRRRVEPRVASRYRRLAGG